MKKLTQNGIGVLSILLIVLLVGAISVIGYSVYQNKNKELAVPTDTINSFDECAAAGNPIMESYPEQCAANGQTFTRKLSATEKKNLNPATTDWQTFNGQGIGVSYPNSWRQFKPKSSTSSTASFVSKDYQEADELGPSVVSGYWLEIFAFGTVATHEEEVAQASYSSFDEHLNYLQTTEQACGGDYHTSTMDALPAVVSTIKCHGSYIEAYVYKNNKEYIFRLNSLDESNSENKKLFDNILSTVVID
jgi:hypothetical protein